MTPFSTCVISNLKIDGLFKCMMFNAVFNSISVISRWPVHLSMLSWSFLTSTPHNIFSKPLAAFPQNYCRTTDSVERGMNPVAMTIINPRKEYWPSPGSNKRPPVLKSSTLPTDLWGLCNLKIGKPSNF